MSHSLSLAEEQGRPFENGICTADLSPSSANRDGSAGPPLPGLVLAPAGTAAEALSTGIPELDQLLQGGVPRGKLVEIAGANSSGKTSLLYSILASATDSDELVAYIDAFDALDPVSVEDAGISSPRLLWVRCFQGQEDAPLVNALERAMKAADILCQAGGFGVIVLDITSPPSVFQEQAGRIPLQVWFRLQRAIKGTPSTLLILSRRKAAGSVSSLVLSLERSRSQWIPRRTPQRPHLPAESPTGKSAVLKRANRFQGIESQACLVKGRNHGAVTIHCHF